MGLSSDTRDSESRLAAYVEVLTSALGHADRAAPFRSYCVGLLLPGTRKSVEPMAARIAPSRVRAMHQSLHHLVAKADWSDDTVLSAVRTHVLPLIERRGAIRGWMIDDTGIPKKGTHSVGVTRQYCGQLGKQDNCQVAVTLSVANDHASLPVAHRLYLPQLWCDDRPRRAGAGVPDEIVFQTKPQIALAQIRAALEAGVRPVPVLADAGIWHGQRFSRRDHRARPAPHCWHPVLDQLVATGLRAAAAQTLERSWPTHLADPTRQRAQADLGQAVGNRAAEECLPARALAGGQQQFARFALRRRARPPQPPRLLATGPPARRVAAHRMARRRAGTDHILARHNARDNSTASVSQSCQAALAHRA